MATSIDIYSKTQVDTLVAAKQDQLTFDNVPTSGSNNPVKSGGVYTALGDKANIKVTGSAPSSPTQGMFWYDTTNGLLKYYDGTNWQTVTTGSGSIAWGAITGTLANQTDLKNALDAKQATLTFDSAPTSGSTNPVTSGGVYTALAGKQDTVSVVDHTSYYTITF